MRIFACCFSVLTSVVLLIATILAYKSNVLINAITDNTAGSMVFSVIAKADSPYNNIQDISGKKCGYVILNDKLNVEKALYDVGMKLHGNIKNEKIDNYFQLLGEFYSGKLDVFLLNEGFRGVIKEIYPKFNSNTRIIYQTTNSSNIPGGTIPSTDVRKDVFNVYISGSDNYGKVIGSSRSDVNIIITVNPTTHKVLLTSIPRDYYVNLVGVNTHGVKDKLTHAGIYGVKCSEDTIAKLLNIKIDFYAKINFTSFIKIIDALGGVDVNVASPFSAGGYRFKKGAMHMNSKMALVFVRDRHHQASGDRDRGQNQERLIKGVIKKLASPMVFEDFGKIASALEGSILTNIGQEDIASVIDEQLRYSPSWNVNVQSLDGLGAKKPTFSCGSKLLYVMIPKQQTVTDATKNILEVCENTQGAQN